MGIKGVHNEKTHDAKKLMGCILSLIFVFVIGIVQLITTLVVGIAKVFRGTHVHAAHQTSKIIESIREITKEKFTRWQ